MQDWWSENGPPVYVAAAAYLGLIKPKKTTKASKPGQPVETGNLNDLLRLAGPGGMIN